MDDAYHCRCPASQEERHPLLIHCAALSIIRGAYDQGDMTRESSVDASGRSFAKVIVGLQLLISILVAGLSLFFLDSTAAAVSLSGGLIMAAATVIVASIALPSYPVASASTALMRLILGALGKYVLVILGLAMLFSQSTTLREERNVLILLSTFFLVQGAYWLAPLLSQSGLARPRTYHPIDRKS